MAEERWKHRNILNLSSPRNHISNTKYLGAMDPEIIDINFFHYSSVSKICIYSKGKQEILVKL
jgi:hypothetical protein